MKISFLVTYYNQQEYVEKSLNSIIDINKPCDWEILIGDDGSTDQTVDRVKRYIKKYPEHIKLYVMDRNKGKNNSSVKRASANRLNLLKHATGDYFCTLDGDDYYCDRKFLEDAIRVFSKQKEVSIVAFGLRYVENGIEGEEITLPLKTTEKIVDKMEYLRKYYLNAGACVYKNLFDAKKIAQIEKIGYFDDNDIVVCGLNCGEMYAINRAIYAYRQTGESVYTSMNALEQAALNVQGFDIDVQLIESEYYEALMERNATQIIALYLWKNKLKKKLGEIKYNRYITEAMELKEKVPENEVVSEAIMNYKELEQKQKKKLDKMVHDLEKKNLRYTLKVWCKYLLGII